MGRLISLVLISILLSPVYCEVFTALTTLTKALYHEKDLADGLRHYVELEKERLKMVLQLADDYDKHADDALSDAENYIANPINAYLFVKKFTTDLPRTRELVSGGENANKFYDLLEEYRPHLPDDEDLDGVVSAVLRLQDTYQLPTHKIADGSFAPGKFSPQMTARDCFDFGSHAHNNGDYYHTIVWMEEAWERLQKEDNSTAKSEQILDYLAFALYNVSTQSARDCYNVGRYAYGKKDWYHMFTWMHQSLDALELEDNQTISKIEVLDYLSYAAAMQGNVRHAKYWTQEWLKLDPLHERANSNLKYFDREIAAQEVELHQNGDPIPEPGVLPPLKNERTTDEYRNGKEFKDYEALCRGEDVMPNPYIHKLKCYYTTSGDNPLLVLAPVKVEEYYLDPYIVLYHDVISDNEIAVVKEISTPMLKRAVVNDPATGQLVTAFYRVSRSAWLRDDMNETVRTISNRIHAVTHLDPEMTEDLQIQNYGIGGQYEPHCDHARPVDTRQFEDWRGNRVATWLVYFTDVVAGGNTVFTQIGAKIPPIKGSAAFWHNLKPDGEGDDKTRHAGCPVLAGSKWVANKWFHERGQEFMRPCGLEPNS